MITRIRTLLARSSVAHGPCDLTGVIRDVLSLVGPEIGRHGIDLEMSLAPDLPQVMGDRIEDTGFGEAEAPRLFEAFYTTKPGGLGMGLSISRSIIDSHRGRLWPRGTRTMAPRSTSRCRVCDEHGEGSD